MIPTALALALAASPPAAVSTTDPGRLHALVGALGARFDRGIRARDFDTLAAIYAEDALYVQDDGPIRRGREEIRRQWISDVEDFGLRDMRLMPVHVEEQADTLVEVGTGESTVQRPDDPTTTLYLFKYVNVWRRAPNGDWLLAIDAYSGLTYAAGSELDRRILDRPRR